MLRHRRPRLFHNFSNPKSRRVIVSLKPELEVVCNVKRSRRRVRGVFSFVGRFFALCSLRGGAGDYLCRVQKDGLVGLSGISDARTTLGIHSDNVMSWTT